MGSNCFQHSAVLLDHMRAYAQIEVFASDPAHFDPSLYDGIVYQVGSRWS